jgi:predicted metal-dependent hydrolase
MTQQLKLGSTVVDVLLKDIRNVHMSVHPPSGWVRISAPMGMSMDTLRVFAIARPPWIKEQQRRLWRQERETPREFLDRESHFLWGRRYLLKLSPTLGRPLIEARHRTLVLHICDGASLRCKEAVLDSWYRQQVRSASESLVQRWEKIMSVEVKRIHVQRMRTRWGGCNPPAHSIRLNSELAKRRPSVLNTSWCMRCFI